MSKPNFKPLPLDQQTLVITGASSGIGLATAKMAAERGAKVVMASRNGEELQRRVDEITEAGGKAIAVMADVSKMEDLSRLRDKALESFGQIDTWINNAGVSLYGYLMDSSMQDERKIFETNFWGTRMGSCIAVEEMSEKGGTLINMGSEVSVAAEPLLGMYSASKHAIKAFTDSLRSELKDRNIPVEVCLIRPTAIDIPFADRGRPSIPEPAYDPDIAAEAILKCAVNPQRDVYVGGPARLSAILDTFFPRIKDIVSESRMKDLRKGEVVPKQSLYKDITTAKVAKSLSGTIKKLKKPTNHEPGREI
ncbi:MAG TPA: SDR family oxidoreductase [Bacteriovoracaceae bacterium]|nr:SDR family oxidoreductase [Bacteriovoracaceae bacterium]